MVMDIAALLGVVVLKEGTMALIDLVASRAGVGALLGAVAS